jgi:PBSX family phage terminase large subunit
VATSKVTIKPNGNDAQRAFVEADRKETFYFGGVGSGKTVGGVMRLARHIFEWNPGEQLAIITPTAPMMRNVILPELRKWDLYREDWHNKGENRLRYPNGTTVILESASNLQKVERLRGLSIAGAWLDEIGQHYEETYHVVGDRLRTGDYRNLWGTGTPKGKNWAYRECVEPLLHNDDVTERPVADGTLLQDDYISAIYGVTTDANRATPEDYKAARKRQHEGHSYKQEILGQFAEPEGLVYGWFDDSHLTTDVPDYERAIYGVDWGFNSPAAAVACLETDDGWHIADEIYVRETTAQDLADAVGGLVDEYGTGKVFCDPAEPANIETFQRRGINAEAAENDVLPGIQHVTSERHGLSIHERCRNLRNEISGYEWKDGEEDKPVKANDHALDALRYALFSDETAMSAGGVVIDW